MRPRVAPGVTLRKRFPARDLGPQDAERHDAARHDAARARPPLAPLVVLLTAGLLACGPGGGEANAEPGRQDVRAEPDGAAADGQDAGAGGQGAGSGGDTVEADPAPGCEAFAERDLAVSVPTRRAFRDALGEPTAVTRTPVANRHVEGQTDSLVAFERPGLAATYYVLPDRDLLSSVAVSDPRWLRYSEPTLGTTRADVESMFGPPDAVPEAADGTTMTYHCSPSPGAEEPVHFDLLDGVVTEIRFTKYVD